MTDNLHKGHRERMKNRIIEHGPKNLADHELLEVLLYYSVPMKDTNGLAHRILNEFGSLSNLLGADIPTIMKRTNVSKNTAVLITLIPEFMDRYNAERWSDNKIDLSSSKTAGEYAKSILNTKTKECFYAIFLDAGNKLIKSELISEGVVNGVLVNVRGVTEKALKNNAVSVILAHNHPGGSLIASAEDVGLTQTIIHALRFVEINVLDHIIVANNDYVSFVELGLINNDNN